jgi:hypothetical protein
MLGRLKMSISEAVTSYNRLMSEVSSDRKALTMGGSEAFKATTLERGLKEIVRGATGDEGERMMERLPESIKCSV